MMPALSVVIPVYNCETYLPRLFASIESQSCKDAEYIFVDDGSLDDSPVLLDRFAASRSDCRVIHQKNGGVSTARNAGIQASRAKAITFLDGDDAFAPDGVGAMCRNLPAADACEVVVFDFFEIRGDRKTRMDANRSFATPEGPLAAMLKWKCRPEPWAKVYPKTFFSDIRFDETLRFEEDFFLLVELFARKNPAIVYVPEPVVEYYRIPGSASLKNDFRRWYDALAEHVIRLAQDIPLPTEWDAKLAAFDITTVFFGSLKSGKIPDAETFRRIAPKVELARTLPGEWTQSLRFCELYQKSPILGKSYLFYRILRTQARLKLERQNL